MRNINTKEIQHEIKEIIDMHLNILGSQTVLNSLLLSLVLYTKDTIETYVEKEMSEIALDGEEVHYDTVDCTDPETGQVHKNMKVTRVDQ